MLEEAGVKAESLLDIGAGIGVLHHELLARGVSTAVQVEASSAYIRAAEAETERRGHGGRVRFEQGNLVNLSPALDEADLVTLDRVLCCYPELDPLVLVSAAKARHWWAASFPHSRWYTRLLMGVENWRRRAAGNAFRTFVHPVGRIHELLGAEGFAPVATRKGWFWELTLWARSAG